MARYRERKIFTLEPSIIVWLEEYSWSSGTSMSKIVEARLVEFSSSLTASIGV